MPLYNYFADNALCLMQSPKARKDAYLSEFPTLKPIPNTHCTIDLFDNNC
jgi:hypothetical protein